MKQDNEFHFTTKNCKTNKHVDCDGVWKGIGFLFYCSCPCHLENNVDGIRKENISEPYSEFDRILRTFGD